MQEDIKIVNVYIPSNRTSTHMKQKLLELKGEIDKSTTTVRFKHPFVLIERFCGLL